MAAGDNMMDLALQITADPTQAEAAVQSVAEQVKSLGAVTQEQVDKYNTFADSWRTRVDAARAAVAAAGNEEVATTQRVATAQKSEVEQLGLVKDAWMQNAAAAREQGAVATTAAREQVAAVDALNESYTNFGSVADSQIASVLADADNIGVAIGTAGDEAEAATAKATRGTSLWHTMNQGIIGDFRLMRYAMYAFTTPLMFTYIIPQIEKMASAIRAGFEALAGYDAELRAVEADARASSEAALTAFGQLDASTRIRLSLISDVNQRTRETLQLEIKRTEQQQMDLRGQIDSVNKLKQARKELHGVEMQMAAAGQSGTFVNPELAQKQIDLTREIAALTSQLGPKISGDLGKAVTQLRDDLDKGNKALTGFQVQLNELKEKPEKAAHALKKAAVEQKDWNKEIVKALAHMPPFSSEIERLQRALLAPARGGNDTILAYAYLNVERLQEGLKPLEATLGQLGIMVPKLTMAGAQSPLSTVIQGTQQLTAAQRLALPTERELHLANAELARDYPNMTAAERAEWAQVMLTSDAYRKHIDESSRVKSSNAQLAGSFNALAMQVRTAFSEMAGQITGWGGVATRVFDQVFNAVSRQIEIEQRQAAEHQISQFSMVKATIDGFKQLAIVKAIIDTAKGIEALASLDFAAAGQWFAAAALWGTVGAFQIAAMAGAFQPGTSGSKAVATAGSSSSSSTTPPPLASGSASAAARQNQQQQILQVVFNGPVVGAGGMQEVADKLNHEVEVHRVKLVASHDIYGNSLARTATR